MAFFNHENLRDWFLLHKRELPWRKDLSPYRVWVSEVMLQQTRAEVVAPYFQRWMRLFPSIDALAQASLDEVIKAWEGLGYYSRARNLHEGALYVVSCFEGVFPQTYEELKKIKGLGPYTICAILCFAFKQRHVPIDGNVFRVLSRFFCLEEMQDTRGKKRLEVLARQILPLKEPWVVAEALIELGALVCRRIPRCRHCPLVSSCQAYQKDIMHLLPIKKPKQQIRSLYRIVAIILAEEHVLLKKERKGKVMADLWEFPYFEIGEKSHSRDETEKLIFQAFSFFPSYQNTLPSVRHTFTRYKAQLFPYVFTCPKRYKVNEYTWIKKDKILTLPFSSGHRCIINKVFSE